MKAPRYQGKISTWKDDQGFGFITPDGAGPAVFVHIKSFTSRGKRPVVDAVVTYDLSVNEKGQPRAGNVAFVDARSDGSSAPAQGGTGSLIAACGFFVLIGAAVLLGTVPVALFGAYLGMSLLTFFAYAVDKSAARNDRRRTPEQTLHMLALGCGWPGALVAQQLLRHKSKKASFRNAFWLTVTLNCAALAWLFTPHGAGTLAAIAS